MKLALVIPSLGGGGAERVMATLANAWAGQGTKITLITLAARSGDKFPLDPAIERIGLHRFGPSRNWLVALANNFMRVRDLRRAIAACNADAIISFMTTTNLLSVLATTGMRIPVVVVEHIFVAAMPPRGAWRAMYRKVYRRAAAVVTLTRRGADDIEQRIGRRVHVIPNPLQSTAAANDTLQDSSSHLPQDDRGERRTLIAMGRLASQKGFDLLVEAFGRIASRHPAWDVVILGEGILRKPLEDSIAAHGLTDRIALPGFRSDPQRELRRSDLFVMPSRFEGFPMALLEAMSEGMACVSFDCTTGPRELIEHGVNGWLVPADDVSALADALDALMQDAPLRKRLGTRAREVRDTYSLPAIIDQWNALLREVMESAQAAEARQRIRTAERTS